jgi:hypothetical protein
MLVGRQIGKRVDRPAWNIGLLQLVEPEGSRPIAYAFGDQRIEFGDMAAPGLRIGETGIVGEFGPARKNATSFDDLVGAGEPPGPPEQVSSAIADPQHITGSLRGSAP